ncbi:MAG: cobyric acid synthase [Hungatella sp.]
MNKAKVIMIQGTMSNAGKSLLTAGLCRIFKQDGYRTAPFKSQNMALNSFITQDGLEMGRAQVVQAEAAGIVPSVDMNPILLKPTTDVGSQVIVNGIHRGNQSAREYFAYKKQLIPVILEAYHRLEEEYEIIVIEGAGSPAEINLRSVDIVNMGLAELVDAPVILVGDIDRGGVFAQLYGTVMLLEASERARIKGLVINKFRGDKTILDSGVQMIEELCGIPVIGVTPYLEVDLEAEDSLSDSFMGNKKHSLVDIAVIHLPRISNFTDFQVFAAMPQVSLRYVASVRELGTPDLILLPGTKSTIADLLWMRQNGLEAAVQKLAAKDIPIFGICGGYQMLGQTLLDEAHLESAVNQNEVRGMQLLPVTTIYENEKTKTRVSGAFGEVSGIFQALSGHQLEGYEIHMGQTKYMEPLDYEGIANPLTFLMESQSDSKRLKMDGVVYGSIYGTYVHGIFDEPDIAHILVTALLQKKGCEEEVLSFDYASYKEEQYEKLAEELRRHLDMKQIYDILGIRRTI